ncbi:GtrA family protein [Variovorax sp. KK3]|uniref:GtrA family protein n=1 Tax=Variovorax sp. KK3 TaxID=1855728 RepID=UPI00097BDB1A|nr:GtrA family protein [Variovorax sp. KK3]
MSQFLRFLTVGVFNTVFGYCIIFACMYLAGLSAEVSNVIGYAVGLTTSYLLNRNFTFRSKQSRRGEVVRFVIVFAIAYMANFLALLLLIRQIGVHEGLSQILAGAVYVLASYAMNKLYVFRNADAG